MDQGAGNEIKIWTADLNMFYSPHLTSDFTSVFIIAAIKNTFVRKMNTVSHRWAEDVFSHRVIKQWNNYQLSSFQLKRTTRANSNFTSNV